MSLVLPIQMRKGMDEFFQRHPELKDVYPCSNSRDEVLKVMTDEIHRLTEYVASLQTTISRQASGCDQGLLAADEEDDIENEVITYKELIKKYNFRGVKSAKDPKWRKKHGFDECVSQSWKGCSVVFVVSKVEEWLANKNKGRNGKAKRNC